MNFLGRGGKFDYKDLLFVLKSSKQNTQNTGKLSRVEICMIILGQFSFPSSFFCEVADRLSNSKLFIFMVFEDLLPDKIIISNSNLSIGLTNNYRVPIINLLLVSTQNSGRTLRIISILIPWFGII